MTTAEPTLTVTRPPRLMTDDQWARMPWHARQRWLLAANAARRRLLEPLMEEVARLRAEIDALEADKAVIRTAFKGPKIIHESPDDWTPVELRAAHSSYTRGNRDRWTVTGHRIWDAARKRRDRRIFEASR